ALYGSGKRQGQPCLAHGRRPCQYYAWLFQILTSSDDSLELSVQLIAGHGNNGRPAMGTVVWILQGQQLIDQSLGIRRGQMLVSLYSSFAGHGSQPFLDHLGSRVTALLQLIQNFYKKLFFSYPVQVGRDCGNFKFSSAKGL